MNVKTTNTVTIFDVSGPKFGVGTKSQILQFSLPNFCDFAKNAVFKLLFGFGCSVGGFFFPHYHIQSFTMSYKCSWLGQRLGYCD